MIVTSGLVSTLAAKAATTSIPIVFAVGADPVRLGLVASLNRPGGNLTGFNNVNNELGTKGLEHVPPRLNRGILVGRRIGDSTGIDSLLGARTMPRAYSADMRERVISRVEGGGSRREAAEHYDVSASSLDGSLYGQGVDAWPFTIADVGPSGLDQGQG